MVGYHQSYPLYNFAQHKGYPTFAHRSILHEHGPCPIHRLTFGPVRDSIRKMETVKIESKKVSKTKRSNRSYDVVSTATTLKATSVERVDKKESRKRKLSSCASVLEGEEPTVRRSLRLRSKK